MTKNQESWNLIHSIIGFIENDTEYTFESPTGDCESSIIISDRNGKEFRLIIREEM